MEYVTDPSDVAKESFPYYKIYNYGKKTLDYTKKYGESVAVYSDPTLDPEFKSAYLCFDAAYTILEVTEYFVPFPFSIAYNIAVQPLRKTIELYQDQIESMVDYQYNDGYKWKYSYSGQQCTNRGLISSNFYVPDYISEPASQPDPDPVMPQLESPQADVPSGTVEAGTVVTLTGPDKGSIYYSLDNGEYTEYTEPIIIEDSTVLKVRTQSNDMYPMYSDSDIVTYVYTIEGQLFAPTLSPENAMVESGGVIELNAKEGETIFYAIDHNLEDDIIPTEDSYVEYTEPIAITENCVIYTFAQKEGYKTSRIAEIPVEVIIALPEMASMALKSVVSSVSDSSSESIKLYYTGRVYDGTPYGGNLGYEDEEFGGYH